MKVDELVDSPHECQLGCPNECVFKWDQTKVMYKI